MAEMTTDPTSDNGNIRSQGKPDIRRPKETSEVAAGARRMIRAVGVRIGDGDLDSFSYLLDLHETIDEATRYACAKLRADHGVSWADIALRLGVTRQAAAQKWGLSRES